MDSEREDWTDDKEFNKELWPEDNEEFEDNEMACRAPTALYTELSWEARDWRLALREEFMLVW